jgi:hypothetical protein
MEEDYKKESFFLSFLTGLLEWSLEGSRRVRASEFQESKYIRKMGQFMWKEKSSWPLVFVFMARV